MSIAVFAGLHRRWGAWTHFVHYTHRVVAFLPAWSARPLSAIATIAEITLGAALLLGVRLRLTASACAGLLAVYGICMTISLQPAQ